MPIPDPGNAATASGNTNGHDRAAADAKANAERGRRVMALAVSLITGLVLLPSALLTLLTGNWLQLLSGMFGWLALCVIASGVVTYRYGPRR